MKRFKKLFAAFAIVFVLSGIAYADEGILCAQVITYGLNPETGEWVSFPTPCDVPEGWETSMTRPEDIEPVDIEPVIAPYQPAEDILCAQVITYGLNPDTGEWERFPTPCDVPEGWETSMTRPEDIEPVIAPCQTHTFTYADNGKSVSVKQGDTIRVVLESNPTTGFVWDVTLLDQSILEMTDTVYESECAEGLLGCGGKEIWTFRAVAPGITDLEIAYVRHWGTAGEPEKTFTLKADVSAADMSDDETAIEIPLFCGADANSDGKLNADDFKGKRDQLQEEFKDWKNNCWQSGEACGDYNGDGITDQKDFLERKAYRETAFRDWKNQCWKPALRIAEARANDIGDKNEVSECGGFDSEVSLMASEMKGGDCRDEKLVWRYNEKNQTVVFLNGNVWLNCCGERSIAVSLNEETGDYEIQETDMPESGSLRCRCMCFYDFQVKLRDIEAGIIKVKLFRIISDAESPISGIWKGQLDLSKGEGEILIAEDVGWCYEEPVCEEEEICGNGLDDDCDDEIDEDCGQPCGGIAGLMCDEGEFCLFETDTCGWADNMGGCTPIPEICTFEYMPVCGCDGKTYGNECQMKAAGQSKAYDGECKAEGKACGGIAGLMCDEGEFCLFEENTCGWADNMGICTPIPEFCTFEYMPVCGCDGKTYGNECAMMAAGQSKDYDGECRTDE